MNRKAWYNCCSWTSAGRRDSTNICVGANRNGWKFKKRQTSIENEKAPICRRSFFYIVRCRRVLDDFILASCGFTCNNSVRFHV
jgi:hypothetical protein